MYEDNLKILLIEPAEKIIQQRQLLIKKRFQPIDGLKILKCEACLIKIEYFAHLFSESFILQELLSLGIMIKKKKKLSFFKRLLNSISKENIESFGNKRMDCCDLNH